MPGLLLDIVRETLSGVDDIEVVENARGDDPAGAIGRLDAATLVWCCRLPPRESTVRELLYVHPGLRILAVVGEGRRGLMHELVPQTSVLREISPQRLLSAVRGRAGEKD